MKNLNVNKFKLLFTHEWFEITQDILGIDFPGLELSYFEIPAEGGLKFKQSGDEITYGELITTIVIDEDMNLLYDLQEFMFELKDPSKGNYINKSIPCVLQLYSATSGKVVREIEFTNLRPVSFSGITLETNTDDVEFRTVEITWISDYWRILKKEEK